MNVETTSELDRFRTLYDANHDRVHRLLGRIAGPHDAEDLTQIVFAKAATALPRFRGDALASTWLYRIASNVASDWLRGRAANRKRHWRRSGKAMWRPGHRRGTAAKPLPLSRTRFGSDPRRHAGLQCARAADARDRDSRHKACESGPVRSSFRRSYSIIAINRMRGFAIYQIGRAGRPRFAARVVSQVFDRDQFLGVEIDLINKEFPI